MLGLEAHLAFPCLLQVLLHNLVFLEQSLVLEALRLDLVLDEFLILLALHLTASIAQLSLSVDLVRQVHLQVLLLLLLTIKVALDLIEGLLGSEVRLVVEGLNLLLDVLDTRLFGDLVADKVAVGTVLLEAVLVLEGLLAVHVVDCRVELGLLGLTPLLDALYLTVEATKSLLVDVTDGFITAITLVGGVVVNCEGALRAEELRHASVVLVRNFLAIQGRLDLFHLLNDAWGGNL